MVCKLKENKKSSALYENSSYNLAFGDGHDLYCKNNCNNNTSSSSRLGIAYDLPTEYKGDRQAFLAGQ